MGLLSSPILDKGNNSPPTQVGAMSSSILDKGEQKSPTQVGAPSSPIPGNGAITLVSDTGGSSVFSYTGQWSYNASLRHSCGFHEKGFSATFVHQG